MLFSDIIESQQSDIANIPIYTDDRITSIPIVDSGECLVDINFQNQKRVRMLPTPTIPFSSPDHNAGFECSSFVRESLYKLLESLSVYLSEALHKDIIVFVYEGLRDLKTQSLLFDGFKNEIKANMPLISDSEATELTCKIISHPSTYPAHSTGGCVDIRLYNGTDDVYLDMGQFGNLWGENKQSHFYCAGLTQEQKDNRSALLLASGIVGLINYPYEWWRFSYGDKYYAYYTKNKYAIYNSI